MNNNHNRSYVRGNSRYERNHRYRNDSYEEPPRMEQYRHNESFEEYDSDTYHRVMGMPIMRAPALAPHFQHYRADDRLNVMEVLPIVPALQASQAPVYHYPPPANYPPFAGRNFSYPVSANDWNSVMAARFAPPVYNYLNPPPLHRVYSPVPVLPSPVCPYTVPPPMLPPMLPTPDAEEVTTPPGFGSQDKVYFSPEQLVPGLDRFGGQQAPRQANLSADETLYENMTKREVEFTDPTEFYLSLPKDVFPTARMLGLDPNPLIDELCKFNNLSNNLPWLLDLEFGLPREPTSRIMPIYDVRYNSIHCKNTPNAVHPGFDSCSEDFKSVLLFYYDCVVSSWYRGYVFMHLDNSVHKFQSWLHIAMLNYGMCWP